MLNLVDCGVNNIIRILDPLQYNDAIFLQQREEAVLKEIAACIANRKWRRRDEHRITRPKIIDDDNTYIIFWDGIRQGIFFRGFDTEEGQQQAPPSWLIFYIPEAHLI